VRDDNGITWWKGSGISSCHARELPCHHQNQSATCKIEENGEIIIASSLSKLNKKKVSKIDFEVEIRNCYHVLLSPGLSARNVAKDVGKEIDGLLVIVKMQKLGELQETHSVKRGITWTNERCVKFKNEDELGKKKSIAVSEIIGKSKRVDN
jgi:hypothetical protein